MKNQGKETEKGQSLIEMLVAVAIFSLLSTATIGLLISAMQSQSRVLAVQELSTQASYVLEYMSRALRMAQKELNCTDQADATTCSCLNDVGVGGYGYNYEITSERTISGKDYLGPGIRFINYEGICQEFFWHHDLADPSADDRLKEWKIGYFEPLPLVAESDTVEVLNFAFDINGQDQPPTDYFQPRVTIFLDIRSTRLTGSPPQFKIQTSVSQRSLDAQF